MLSECCSARPLLDIVDEIDDMYMGICGACGEHAVFYDEYEEEENTLQDEEI